MLMQYSGEALRGYGHEVFPGFKSQSARKLRESRHSLIVLAGSGLVWIRHCRESSRIAIREFWMAKMPHTEICNFGSPKLNHNPILPHQRRRRISIAIPAIPISEAETGSGTVTGVT
jgi:hypothetical protein